MAKQMMQDVLTNKDKNDEGKESYKEDVSSEKADHSASLRQPGAKPIIEDSIQAQKEVPETSSRAPAFTPLETSPIFEKMKRRNKERESFSDEYSTDKKHGGGGIFGKFAIVFAVLFVAGAFLYGIFFYDAVLDITLKHADVTLQNQEFTAGVPATGATSTETLPYQLMTLSDETSSELTATGEKNVVTKSSGKIVVYNDFGTQNQPLIKNTRFETADGKIYRIRDSIIVPGQKTVNGKKVPGSLEVAVYADAAGAEYNIGLVDFTIPGFKKSPKYDKFYARSKTPMVGGASGLTKVVSDSDIQKARETLTATLKEKLMASALAQKPKGTVLYKDAVFYSFTDSMGDTATSDKTVKLTMKGSLTATLFNADDLSKWIVKASVSSADLSSNDHILVTNIEDLGFAVRNASNVAPKENESYSFSLNGTAHAVWQIDTVALAGKLAGLKKSDYKNVFTEFPGIEKANAHIRPFWKTKFPSDVSKIRIEITPN